MQKSRFPDSLVLIFAIIIAAQLLSYVLPHGQYDRVPVEGSSRMMVADGTYHAIEGDQHVTLQPWSFLTALPEGLEAAQDIIFLVFLVGGVVKHPVEGDRKVSHTIYLFMVATAVFAESG